LHAGALIGVGYAASAAEVLFIAYVEVFASNQQ
jgi:hypothetical protein